MRAVIGPLATQGGVVASPIRGASRLVVACHGAGEVWNFASDPAVSWPTLRETAYYLAQRGYTVAVPALFDTSLTSPGQTWGNDASSSQLADVVTAAKAMPGVSAGKYAILGCSMGNLTALNHARRVSYSGIAGVLGVIPACGISPYRGTDSSQEPNYSYVNDAYDVANDGQWDAIKLTYEPIAFGSSVTIPVALWTNSNDIIAVPALADALAAENSTWISRRNLGSSSGTFGHDFDLLVPEEVHEWLETLAW